MLQNSRDRKKGKEIQYLCREYTNPREPKGDSCKRLDSQESKIRPCLEQVCSQDDRYSFEVEVPSPKGDQTAPWVRIVSGVDKFVRESMLTK